MNKLKKTLALLLSLVMILSLLPAAAFAEDDEAGFWPTKGEDGWSYGTFEDALGYEYDLSDLDLTVPESISIQLNTDIGLTKDLSLRGFAGQDVTYAISSGSYDVEGYNETVKITRNNHTILIPVGISVWLENIEVADGENIDLFSAPEGYSVRKAEYAEYYYLIRDAAYTPAWTRILDPEGNVASAEFLASMPCAITVQLYLDGEEEGFFFPMTSTLEENETIKESLDALWVDMVNAFGDLSELYTESIVIQVEPVTYVAQIGETNYETLEAAVADAKANDTITLLADVVTTTKISNSVSVTLDLAGHTVYRESKTSNTVLSVGQNTVLTINDTVGDGRIISDYAVSFDSSGSGKMGKLIVNGGSLEGNVRGVNVKEGASLEVNGGQITGGTYGIYSAGSGSNIIITDGAIWGGDTAFKETNNSTTVATITGGTFMSSSEGVAAAVNASSSIEGGEFSGSIEFACPSPSSEIVPFIEGGYFSGILDDTFDYLGYLDDYVKSGFVVVGNPDTNKACFPYKVVEEDDVTLVAQIGNVKYTTLADAVAAAENDSDTITITGETSLGGIALNTGDSITVGATESVTGTSISAKEVTITDSNDDITTAYVLSDGEHTNAISSEKVAVDSSSIANENVEAAALVNVAKVIAQAVSASQTVSIDTLTDVTISLAKEQPTDEQLQGVEVPEDAVAFEVHPVATVKVIQANEVVQQSSYDVQNEDLATGASFTFSLGLGEDFANKTVVLTHYYGTNETESLGCKKADENGVVSGVTLTSFSVVTAQEAVAQIDSTYYATLADAIAAATDGQTITLLVDCSGSGIIVPQGKFTTGLTVDFAGHTYTVNSDPLAGSTGTKTQAFQLLKDNKITFTNGTITGSSRANSDLMRIIQNYADLTLDHMTLSLVGQYYNQITMSNCNGEIAITNSTVNAPDYTWANISNPATVGSAAMAVGTFSSYTAVSVEVTGNSIINGDVSVKLTNPEANPTTTLTLTSGTLNGNILMKDNAATDATVTKADAFTQAAPEGFEWEDKGNGTATLKPISQAVINPLGGSLRRRINASTNMIVNTETDVRFGFEFTLPAGESWTESDSVYFLWSTSSNLSNARTVVVKNCNKKDGTSNTYVANLVITGVPAEAYSTTIYAKLVVNGQESDICSHSVLTICDGLIEGTNIPALWRHYAEYLRGSMTEEEYNDEYGIIH